MKELNLLIWLTQLGISVAVPPALCILGAVWLRNRFGLGLWVLILGIAVGFCLAIDAFRTSLKVIEQTSRPAAKDSEPNDISSNEHA